MKTTAHFDRIRTLLLQELDKAQTSIQAAVAWFTDRDVFWLLLSKLQQGVAVSLIIRNDYVNNREQSLDWQLFLNTGGMLYFCSEAEPIHHKFCVVDQQVLLTGSYNWTYMAHRHNRENCLVSDDSALVHQFEEEFHALTTALVPQTQIVRVSLGPVANQDLLAYAQQDEVLQEQEVLEQDQSAAVKVDYETLFAAAEQAALRQDYAVAQAAFEALIVLRPSHGLAYYNLAVLHLRSDKFAKALRASKQAEHHGYVNASMWHVRGIACLGLKHYAQAITYFDKSIHLEPESSESYFQKMETLQARGRPQEAEQVRLEVLQVASAGIDRLLQKEPSMDLMMHYIDHGSAHRDIPLAHEDALAAKRVYEAIPAKARDQYYLGLIQDLLRRTTVKRVR